MARACLIPITLYFLARRGPERRASRQWLTRALGRPATLLDIAGSAAHASERTAAPIACWLVGRSDFSADQALAIARQMEAGA